MTALSPYPIELQAPDISPYRHGNTGIDYVHSFEAAVAGPHVMIAALVHGNELCGALTLEFLLREKLRPRRGRLTLAFMNVGAFECFDPSAPSDSRSVDEDFNRVWSEDRLDGPAQSQELARARRLRPLIDTVDYLLDIHSMAHPTAPLVLCGPTTKGRELARAIGFPKHVVADAGHAAGRRLRDYGAFGDAVSPKNALLIECGQHWATSSARVANEMALRFLAHFDVLDEDFARQYLPRHRPPSQQMIVVTHAVTIETERFSFVQPFIGMEILPQAGTLLGHDDDREIRTPHENCVLIMPTRNFTKGNTAVRLGRLIK